LKGRGDRFNVSNCSNSVKKQEESVDLRNRKFSASLPFRDYVFENFIKSNEIRFRESADWIERVVIVVETFVNGVSVSRWTISIQKALVDDDCIYFCLPLFARSGACGRRGTPLRCRASEQVKSFHVRFKNSAPAKCTTIHLYEFKKFVVESSSSSFRFSFERFIIIRDVMVFPE
jgi:hypothetical protein